MTKRIAIYLVVGLVAAGLIAWALLEQDAPQPSTSAAATSAAPIVDDPTYAEHVAPIVHSNCVTCHRPGEVAPFSLTTYDEVRKRARQIVQVTQTGYMPPWQPVQGYGHFQGERHLTDTQIQTLARWVETGMPEGQAIGTPALPSASRWQLGEPDAVIRFAEPFELAGDATDVYRNFVIPMSEFANRHVRGIAFREDNRHLIHHASMLADTSGTARQQDALDELQGYAGMEDGVPPGGHFFGWTPGRTASLLEEGMAWTVEPNTDLVLQLHMLPSGRDESVHPEIGLYLTDQPPTKIPSIVHLGATQMDIPAGESRYVVEDSFALPVAVEAHSIYPHAHYLGKEIKIWAELAGGGEIPILWIDDWDFNWQDEYRFATPLNLPAGAVLKMRTVYDNSADNVRNPHDPPQNVKWGPASTDEMADVWIKVVADGSDAQRALRAAVGRKTLALQVAGYRKRAEDDPSDFDSRSRLGQLFLAQRQYPEALEFFAAARQLQPDAWHVHYNAGVAHARNGSVDAARQSLQRAIQIDPTYVPALVNLGTVEMMVGRHGAAVASLRKAVRIQPNFMQARVNLGAALSRNGQHDEAIAQYRKATSIDPSFAAVHNNLASALIRTERYDEAATSAQRAIELDPELVDAIKNLGFIRAQQGRLDEARAQFERALALNPNDADAKQRLSQISAMGG